MSEIFCQSTDTVTASLSKLFKHQGKLKIVGLLESAKSRIEETDYDNWDGGIYIFTLFLDVPIKLFAEIEPKIAQFEKAISQKLKVTLRNTGNHRLVHASISPILETPLTTKIFPRPGSDDIDRIWQENCLRLFLSHVAAHKTFVSHLKKELLIYGISCFVAHDDIEPTKEWENEIKLAIGSAHALVALLTTDFHESKWTDQEVGIAINRGMLVIPVKLGCDPYGFMARNQALTANFEATDKLTLDLVKILLKDATTSKTMHEVLTHACESTSSFKNAQKISYAIIKTNNFTQQQVARIQNACVNNDQVVKSYGVPERISQHFTIA